ncbi:hypothetical protein [Methylogaea oryzae]|uniref:hypothetical protein n=1 Tax=Methylogaea oryzae TaxID=1295382 RepID=UPI0020D1435A|nr:hypothetical protein [Methylogaea oryzae]
MAFGLLSPAGRGLGRGGLKHHPLPHPLSRQRERGVPSTVTQGKTAMKDSVVWFENLGIGDVGQVGGKNASLGR